MKIASFSLRIAPPQTQLSNQPLMASFKLISRPSNSISHQFASHSFSVSYKRPSSNSFPLNHIQMPHRGGGGRSSNPQNSINFSFSVGSQLSAFNFFPPHNPVFPFSGAFVYANSMLDEKDFQRKADSAFDQLKKRLLTLGDQHGFDVEGESGKLEVMLVAQSEKAFFKLIERRVSFSLASMSKAKAANSKSSLKSRKRPSL